MTKYFTLLSVIFLSGAIAGCAKIIDTPKVLWGSSTRALEEARGQGVSQTFDLTVDESFEKVIKIAQAELWEVFTANRSKGMIVVMGTPGSVNTTQTGIFVSENSDNKTKVEIVTFSPEAKETVSEILFTSLLKPLDEIKPPPKTDFIPEPPL